MSLLNGLCPQGACSRKGVTDHTHLQLSKRLRANIIKLLNLTQLSASLPLVFPVCTVMLTYYRWTSQKGWVWHSNRKQEMQESILSTNGGGGFKWTETTKKSKGIRLSVSPCSSPFSSSKLFLYVPPLKMLFTLRIPIQMPLHKDFLNHPPPQNRSHLFHLRRPTSHLLF